MDNPMRSVTDRTIRRGLVEEAPTELAGPEPLIPVTWRPALQDSGICQLESPSPPLAYSNSKSILITLQLKIITHTCNPSAWELRQEDY